MSSAAEARLPAYTVFVQRSRILDEANVVDAAREHCKGGDPDGVCGLFSAAGTTGHDIALCQRGLHLLDSAKGNQHSETIGLVVPIAWIADTPGKNHLFDSKKGVLCCKASCIEKQCTFVHLSVPEPVSPAIRHNAKPKDLQDRLDAALRGWKPSNAGKANAVPDASATWGKIANQLSQFSDRIDFTTNRSTGARAGGAFVYTWDRHEGPFGIPLDDESSDTPRLPAFFAAEIPVTLPELLRMNRMIPLSLCPSPTGFNTTLATAVAKLFPLGNQPPFSYPDVKNLKICAPSPDWKEDAADQMPAWSTVFAVVSATLYNQGTGGRKCFASLYLVPVP